MLATRAPYVTLGGVLIEPENRVRLDHIEPCDQSPQWPEGEGDEREPALMVQFLDPQGAVLLRHPIEMQPLCLLPPRDGNQREVSEPVIGGIVPLPVEASSLEIVGEAGVLAVQQIPAAGPEIGLEWTFDDAPKQGRTTVKWSAHHPDGAAMAHSVWLVREDGSWQALTSFTTATEAEIDLEGLPGGKVAIGIRSTDGFNVTRVQSAAVVRPLSRCRPVILSPMPGQHVPANEAVLLLGHAFYLETGGPEDEWLFWSSSLDGALGAGSAKSVRLRAGTHVLTLRAGVPGREGQAQVEIIVGDSSVHTPEAGSRWRAVAIVILILLILLVLVMIAAT